MIEFCKPWRRKIGVCTLIMACVFMGGWVRSQHFSDSLKCRIGPQHQLFIRSNNDSFALSLLKEYQPGQFTFVRIFDSSPVQVDRSDAEYLGFNFCGFKFGVDDGTATSAGFKISNPPTSYFISNPPTSYFCHAPYWSITIPLTLISCWLLLSKPRPNKPKSPVHSLPETVI